MDNLFWRGVLPPGLKGSYDFVHPDPPLFCFPPHATVSPFDISQGTRVPLLSPARSPPIDRNIRPISAFVSYAFARGGNERFSIADSFAIRNVISLIRNKILTNLPRGMFTTKGRKMMAKRRLVPSIRRKRVARYFFFFTTRSSPPFGSRFVRKTKTYELNRVYTIVYTCTIRRIGLIGIKHGKGWW